MLKSKIYFVILVFLGLVCCTMMVYFVYQHELIHQMIYEDYDISSRVEYKLSWKGFGGTTLSEGNYSACNDICEQAQEQNEIVGYYFEIFLQVIFVLAFTYVFMKFLIQAQDESDEFNDYTNNLKGGGEWKVMI